MRSTEDYQTVTSRLRGAASMCAASVLATVAAVSAAGCRGDDGATLAESEVSAGSTLKGVIRTPPLRVGDVELPDESPAGRGKPFAMRARPGGLLLVYFGYTACPDICPTTLADIGAALRGMDAERRRIEVAMVTFDPARDTGDVISSYLDHFVEGGHALRTEDPEQLEAAESAFHVVARRVEDGGTYSFEHTAMTYAVDENGTVLVEWPFGTTWEDMRSDIRLLLDRSAEANDKETTR